MTLQCAITASILCICDASRPATATSHSIILSAIRIANDNYGCDQLCVALEPPAAVESVRCRVDLACSAPSSSRAREVLAPLTVLPPFLSSFSAFSKTTGG